MQPNPYDSPQEPGPCLRNRAPSSAFGNWLADKARLTAIAALVVGGTVGPLYTAAYWLHYWLIGP